MLGNALASPTARPLLRRAASSEWREPASGVGSPTPTSSGASEWAARREEARAAATPEAAWPRGEGSGERPRRIIVHNLLEPSGFIPGEPDVDLERASMVANPEVRVLDRVRWRPSPHTPFSDDIRLTCGEETSEPALSGAAAPAPRLLALPVRRSRQDFESPHARFANAPRSGWPRRARALRRPAEPRRTAACRSATAVR